MKHLMKAAWAFNLLVLMIGAAWCTGCRKEHTSPLSDLKFSSIVTVNGSLQTTYRIVYGSNNKVDTIAYSNNNGGSSSTGYMQFSYFNNYYIINHSNGYRDSVALNKNNNIVYAYLAGNGNVNNFVYNAQNQMTEQIISGSGTSVDTIFYNWGSFDINYILNSSTAIPAYYSFDPNINGQTGDGLRINQFLSYGATYINSPHLPLNETFSGNTVETFDYQYDDVGRITQLSIAENFGGGSSPDTLTYTYQYAN